MKKILLLLCAGFMLGLAGCATEEKPSITGITVDAGNTKYWYVSGSEIDPSGIVVTAAFSDGTTEIVPVEDCEITAPPFAPFGTKEVTVTYRDCQASYEIYTCTSAAETDQYTTYAIRTNENGSRVSLTASLVGEEKPFVLIFPGGGYEAVYMRQEGYDYASKINELGYNAFILEYSVNMEHPAPLNDVNMAYEIIEANCGFFGVSMEDYAVCGSSAGGHLAATWASKPVGYEHYGKPKPAAVILAYAATHIFEDSRTNLLGENPSEERRKSLSVDENVDGEYPPTYSWVFVEDDVAVGHVPLMDKALEQAGVRHESKYFTGGKHGVGLAEGYEAEGWMDEAIRFWQENAG